MTAADRVFGKGRFWTGRRALAVLLFAAILAVLGAPRSPAPAASGSLAGKFLVATPAMGDPRFAETVIFMVRHDESGAMGLVINRVIAVGALDDLLSDFGIDDVASESRVRVHYGGPVEGNFGFVLHSAEFHTAHTIEIDGKVALTADVEVLKAIAAGKGPERYIFAVGYAGWGPGQLEAELAQRAWFTLKEDEDFLFDRDVEHKWQHAVERRGVDL